MVGSQVARNPELTKRIVDDGNELGLHTFTHADLTTISAQQLDQELSQSQLAMAGAAGAGWARRA